MKQSRFHCTCGMRGGGLLPTALGGRRYIELQSTGVEAKIRQGLDAVEAEKAKGSKKTDAKDSRIESVNFLMFHAGRIPIFTGEIRFLHLRQLSCGVGRVAALVAGLIGLGDGIVRVA